MFSRLFVVLFITFFTFGLLLQDAEARRFGGGRSFGYSRSYNNYSQSMPSQNFNAYSRSQNQYGMQRPSSGFSRWTGPLLGLVAGGLLGALLMNHGLGTGLLTWLLLGGAVIMLIQYLKNRSQPKPAYKTNFYESTSFARDTAEPFMRNSHASTSSYQPSNNVYPIGFDAPSFLREAKANFLRLQAAYDAKNLNDLREFTSPEVYAEIQLQLQERGNAINHTQVLQLEANLLAVEPTMQMVAGIEMETYLASVKFTALMQEEQNQAATDVIEIWHFKKEIGSQRWIVAGLQQG